MKAIARATVAAMAVAVLAGLALAGTAQAADPSATPTVGGRLALSPDRVISVTSQGSVPAVVALAATDVRLSRTSFHLDPGETAEVTYTGPDAGSVSATFVAQVMGVGGESNSLTLALNIRPPVQPPPPYAAIAGGLLLLGGVAFLLARTKPWRYRLVRAPESPPQPQRQRRAPRPAWADRKPKNPKVE